MFVKKDISRNKKFLCLKIIDAITLLVEKIPKKKTMAGMSVKFVIGVNISGITKTLKNPYVRISKRMPM